MPQNEFKFLLVLYLLVSVLSCRQEEKTERLKTPDYSALTEELEAVKDSSELMGMAVAVVKNGELVYEQGFGMADLERELPVTPNTKFRVASISKSATATALMILYDQGKIDLDRDVSDYLSWELRNPKYPETPITLRMLMSHQSSIRDGEGYYAFSRAMGEQPLHIKELFLPSGKYYTEDIFMDHKPGTFFTYSNCTWGLVAGIIEKMSGQRFDEFCHQNIFQPLGTDAGFNPRHLEALDSLGVLYRFEDGDWKAQADNYNGSRPEPRAPEGYELGSNGLLYGPQGSLRISAHDLSKFMLLHLHDGEYEGRRILQPETARLMHANHWTYNGNNGDTYHDFFFSWGLGFHRITRQENKDIVFPHRDMVGHPGEAYGLISDMYFDQDSGTGVIFITNGSKKDFATGERTTFYRPEEATFEAIWNADLL